VASIDLKANDQADANVLVKVDDNWAEQVCRTFVLWKLSSEMLTA